MGLFSVKEDSAMADIFGKATPRTSLKRKERDNIQNETEDQDLERPSDVESENDDDSEEEISEDEQEDDVDENDEAEAAEEIKQPTKKRSKIEDDIEEQYFEKLLGSNDKSQTSESAKKQKITIDSKVKDKHTVFLGNVPNVVITDKAKYRELEKVLAKYGEVVSIRFRSIAFSEMLPRKAAFIKQKLHPSRDSVNAYVVYVSEESATKALALNGELFAEHHLRVDSVSDPAPHVRKRSVFVGNLDFEAAEEPLYRHFEQAGPIEYVRIIRDSKTNVGKGIGYVQFQDTPAVQAALMLNKKPLNGRELRVSRVKAEKPGQGKATSATGPAARGARGAERKSKSERKADVKRGNTKPNQKGRITKVASAPGTALEGNRAKPGENTSLGRKPRHRATRPGRSNNKPKKN